MDDLNKHLSRLGAIPMFQFQSREHVAIGTSLIPKVQMTMMLLKATVIAAPAPVLYAVDLLTSH